MSAGKHTPDDLREFAQQHAPALAEKITRLCGAVIAKGMQGILEEVCRIQAERDELLDLLQAICDQSDERIPLDGIRRAEPEQLYQRAKALIAKAAGSAS